MDYHATRKEMPRTLKSIDRYLHKKFSKFTDVTFVVGVNYISECNHSLLAEWKFLGDGVLCRKLREWTPALDASLALGEAPGGPRVNWMDTPASAEKRAEKTRLGLRLLWADHMKNTPYEGKKQMFDLVKKGVCRKFEWWDRVTDGAPFESKTIDDPMTSKKIYAHIAAILQHS